MTLDGLARSKAERGRFSPPTLTQMKLEHVDKKAANAEEEEEEIQQRSKPIKVGVTCSRLHVCELLLWPTFDIFLILLQPHLMVMICPKSSS